MTYGLWKHFTSDGFYYYESYEKIVTFSVCVFMSIFTILVDLVGLPFELLGIIIFYITKKGDK